MNVFGMRVRGRAKSPVVLMVAPMQPRQTGVAQATAGLASLLEALGVTVRLDSCTVAPRRRRWLTLGGRLLAETGCALQLLAGARTRSVGLAYRTLAGGRAGWLDLLWVLIARAVGCRVVLHHHSFQYLDAPTTRTRVLSRVLSRDTHHLALCSEMADRICKVFETERVAVVDNLALLPSVSVAKKARDRSDVVIVGHLGLLCRDKGSLLIVEAAMRCAAERRKAKFLLAGRFGDDDTRRAIERAALEGSLEYLGVLDPSETPEFFNQLDLFVLPTSYRDEAQPLVLYQAMQAGNWILTCRRGCIGSQIRGYARGALCHPTGAVDEILSLVERLAFDAKLQHVGQDYAELQHLALEAARVVLLDLFVGENEQ